MLNFEYIDHHPAFQTYMIEVVTHEPTCLRYRIRYSLCTFIKERVCPRSPYWRSANLIRHQIIFLDNDSYGGGEDALL